MRTRISTFLESIKGKISLYIGSAIVLMTVAVIAFFGTRGYENLQKAHESLIVENATSAALSVEKENYDLISVARTMAESQQGGFFGRRQESINYAKSVLLDNPRFTAVFFVYEPNADQNDEASLRVGTQTDALDAGGRFLPRWFRDSDDPNLVKLHPFLEMGTELIYRRIKEMSAGDTCLITEPHPYLAKTLVEGVCPIVIHGVFAGVAGVARLLTSFRKHLRELDTPYETADFFLISHQGRVITTTLTERLEMEDVVDTPYEKVLDLFSPGKIKEASLRLLQDPVKREPYYYAGVPIDTGQWVTVLRVSEDELNAPVRRTMLRVSAISVVGVLLTLAVVLWIADSITKPISAAIAVAGKVAAGDLTARVDVTSDGETGQLLDAISTMTHSLNTLVGQVQLSSVSLGSTATQIASTAKRQATTAKEASAFTKEIMTSTQEISTTSQEFAQIAKDISEVAAENATLADAGRTGLTSMENTMRQLLETNSAIAAKFTVLSEKANNINSVVTTITKVADQTNILSLNAAIEAEKAGEYGRGFAVVAREIRRLADQTAVATLDIEHMVKEMQAAVAAGVTGLSVLTEEVRRGYVEVGKVNTQLAQIIEQIQMLAPRLATFNQSVQSQSTSAQWISESMVQLGTVTQQIADALHETDQAIGLLSEEAQALREEVARFKVNLLE
ncbi:MAG TPA: methyl-accepting chemotaxis protein [Candidatus Binatia bacterium]|nr:methyl-accepting chemotaxis protein [Candidatus Binatia bacterium]